MVERESQRPQTVTIEIPAEAVGERLDKYLGNREDLRLSRTKVQKLAEEGLVLCDGRPVATKHKLSGGETVVITVPPEPEVTIVGEEIPIQIVYQDQYLAVVNKPAGMVTHPAAGHRSGTLVNALVHHFGSLASEPGGHRPGIVHRLDKGTSGLLVVARQDDVYLTLQKRIKAREVKRSYIGVICGHMKEDAGRIDLPIGRSTTNRKKMAVSEYDSRQAVTDYRLVRRYRSYDLLDVALGTGRTHQIRVHFSHLGHPILGDPDYGGREKWHRGMFGPERPLAKRMLEIIDRQVLHAARLEFEHPIDGRRMAFEVPPPPDMASVLELLESEGG